MKLKLKMRMRLKKSISGPLMTRKFGKNKKIIFAKLFQEQIISQGVSTVRSHDGTKIQYVHSLCSNLEN